MALAIAAFVQLSAQQTLRQVIILNEGKFGGPVTVGSYDPATRTYKNFDTLNLKFASDVITDDKYIYVAADSKIIKYDIETKQRIVEQNVQGARELALWEDQLLVTRGDMAPLSSYFQVYDKNTLNLIYELPTISERSAEVKVMNNTAYVAVNGFGTVGKLAVIDLKNKSLREEIDLGPDGLNPETVEIEPLKNTIYTVNTLDFKNASVSSYNAATAVATSDLLHRPSSCSGAMYYLNNIYFQTNGQDYIGVYSASGKTIWDSLMVGKSLYGIGVDPVNAHIYLSETDYTTYGKVFVYDFFAKAVDSFDVGISPGSFAFDIRSAAAGVEESADAAGNLLMQPNPTSDNMQIGLITSTDVSATVILTDILGKEILRREIPTNIPQTISLENLPQGAYLLTAKTSTGTTTRTVLKQ